MVLAKGRRLGRAARRASVGASLLLLGACPSDSPTPGETDPATSSTSASTGTGPAEGTTSADTTADSADTEPADCTIEPFEDDLRLEDASGEDLSGDVARVVVIGGTLVGCGDGFVQPSGADPLAIPGRCTGLTALGDDRGAAVTDAGATVLFSVVGDGASELDLVEDAGASHHDVAAHAGSLYVASGTQGLVRFDVAGDGLAAPIAVPGASDARGVASVDAGLLVADGANGARLVDPDGGGSLEALDLDPDAADKRIARRVVVDGERAYVLRGGFGVSVVSLAGGALALEATVPTEGIALDAAIAEGDLLVATGGSLLRIAVDAGEQPVSLSRQVRPAYGEIGGGWFRTVTATADGAVAGVGDRLVPVSLGAGQPQPTIQVERATYSFWAEQGEPTETIITLDNLGGAPMVIADLGADPFAVQPLNLTERPGCPGQFVVDAQGRGLVQLNYANPAAEVLLGTFTATTDTSDNANYALRVEVNRPLAAYGDPAPAFEVLSSDGRMLRATDYEDRVVFIKVFNET